MVPGSRSRRHAGWPANAAGSRPGARSALPLPPIRLVALILAVGLSLALSGCQRTPAPSQPNVLWIVWDTVRADRLSLYGHERATTPFLARWSRQARVFDDCSSIASTTVPSHASMFTNLLPHQHGASNVEPRLADELETLPEIFRRHGWQTCLYSENPYISRESGFAQGFDTVFVPWDRQLQPRAAALLEEKIPPAFRNPQLGNRLRESGISHWALSAAGALGEEVVLGWLQRRDPGRPFFVFMNYMEAHAPVITPERYRRQMMSESEVRRSYAMNVTPLSIWMHTFELDSFAADELEIIGRTYDAALLELDSLLESLMRQLESRGLLENTIVAVVADHGEHLGQHHHLLDHQYSVYEPLLRVPLVLHYPPKVPAGRESRPVSNLDLYPTLLSLASIESPSVPGALSVSLLEPRSERSRYASYLAVPTAPFEMVRRQVPGFDPARYVRALRAIERDRKKLIYASDQRHELYDLAVDPHETRNIFSREPELAAALTDSLRQMLERTRRPAAARSAGAPFSEQQKELLKSLGYTGTDD